MVRLPGQSHDGIAEIHTKGETIEKRIGRGRAHRLHGVEFGEVIYRSLEFLTVFVIIVENGLLRGLVVGVDGGNGAFGLGDGGEGAKTRQE